MKFVKLKNCSVDKRLSRLPRFWGAEFQGERTMTLAEHRKYLIMTTAVKDIQSGIILDVGCSEAYAYLESILATGFEVVGLNLNRYRMETTRNRLKSCGNFHLLIADAQYLPFKKKSLDRIICGEVIEHLPMPRLLLRSAYDSLKECGILIISTPNKIGLQEMGHHFLSKLRNVKQNFHINLFTYTTLLASLVLEGFKVREVASQGIGIDDIIQRVFGRPILSALEISISKKLPKQVQRGWIVVSDKIVHDKR